MEPDQKKCLACFKMLSLEKFGINVNSKDQRNNRCKECRRIIRKASYAPTNIPLEILPPAIRNKSLINGIPLKDEDYTFFGKCGAKILIDYSSNSKQLSLEKAHEQTMIIDLGPFDKKYCRSFIINFLNFQELELREP